MGLALIIKAIKKGNHRTVFTFEASSAFLKFIPQFLLNCKFTKGKYLSTEEKYLLLSGVDYFSNKNYDIDLIYTSHSVYLIVRASESRIKRIIEYITKKSTWSK